MEYDLLRNLSISPSAIACYESLCEHGPATVDELSKRLGKQRTGLYRELKKLAVNGFVISHKEQIGITYYYAVSLEKALENLASHHFMTVLPIILYQRSGTASKKHLKSWF